MQTSLFHGVGNTQNGILGVILPAMTSSIIGNEYTCTTCGNIHNYIGINDSTVIKEFSYNYYIPNNKCYWTEDERFCVLTKWEDFISNPEIFIEQAFQKRNSEIANKTKVRP
jgi:hypothetical protein